MSQERHHHLQTKLSHSAHRCGGERAEFEHPLELIGEAAKGVDLEEVAAISAPTWLIQGQGLRKASGGTDV